jgi:hypothetical protein
MPIGLFAVLGKNTQGGLDETSGGKGTALYEC